ncbi:MAG: biotin transporter BioY [Candidatus Methanomethyliaceae archaeon]|nr:biotin transporter BioY [Candidatus Methanomethyliaceae archaeon]
MFSSRIIAVSAIFASLTAIGAWISIPIFNVPFTLQTFFVYLSVLLLRKYAFISQGIYILMGLIGLPVFAMGKSAYAALLGPTGGYILGFFLGSFSGLLKRDVPSVFLCMTIIFGLGWLWLSYWIGFHQAFLIGVLPFIPWDLLKAILALTISRRYFKSTERIPFS